MSRLKEIVEKARRDKSRLEQELSEAQAQNMQQQAEKLAKEAKERNDKLQIARELLIQVDAQGLLTAIRDEVWGIGEIEDNLDVKWEWPKIELLAKETFENYVHHYTSGVKGIGGGCIGGHWETRCSQASLLIATGEDDYHLHKGILLKIARKNKPFSTEEKYKKNYYAPNFVKILENLGQRSNKNIFIIGELTKRQKIEINPFAIDDLREVVTSILQEIIYADVLENQLPKDFFAREEAIAPQNKPW